VTIPENPILIVGGGIGGLAAALALAKRGFPAIVLEQAQSFGEIGAGIQLGPNAFHVLDRLGLGAELKRDAVFIDRLVMMDSLSGDEIAAIPVDAPFRARFGNPYAVIHRADLHGVLLAGCRAAPEVTLLTSQQVVGFEETASGVAAITRAGARHTGRALVGADGLRSKIREIVVADGPPRVAGHVTFRAVLPIEQMPEDLRWNAATLWAGPNTHLVHYPLRGWKLFNVVATFHSGTTVEAVNEPGDRDEILSAFRDVGPKPRSILEQPPAWRRWVLCDREPVETWTQGRVTLLGDAAHPMLQYFAQGACIALEDALTLAAKLAQADGDAAAAFRAYQAERLVRTARVQWSSRMLGELYHARGPYRRIRKQVFGAMTPEEFYDSLEWIYGWRGE
jgi:3-hydroxybenzoate 6-monooxygenase